MSDQPKHSEVKKEKEERITDEVRSPVGEFDSEKRIGKSGILAFASVLAIAYIVLLLLGLFSLGSWVGGFLGIHMISFIIATILLWNGNVNGNKATLYIAAAIYVFSFIAAGDPSWVINHIPPLVVGVLVLIGTIFLRDVEE